MIVAAALFVLGVIGTLGMVAFYQDFGHLIGLSGSPKPVKSSAPVRLDDAFAWTCPNCGGRNYVECETRLLSREEQREAAIQMGELEPWQELPPGHVVTCHQAPVTVECRCGLSAETVVQEPEDGWEDESE